MIVTNVIRRAALGGFVGFVLAIAAGCGGAVPVSGDVSYDGQPINDGTITFVPTGAKDDTKFSAHIENGKYQFLKDRGPPAGKYKIEVTWLKPTGAKVPTGDGPPQDAKVNVLPEKFNSQTKLTAEVSGGTRKLDFALKGNQ